MDTQNKQPERLVSINISPAMIPPQKQWLRATWTKYETLFLVGTCCAVCTLIVYIQFLIVCKCNREESAKQHQPRMSYSYGAYDYTPLASSVENEKLLPAAKESPPTDMEKYPHLNVKPRHRVADGSFHARLPNWQLDDPYDYPMD